MDSADDLPPSAGEVSLFRDLRIKACLAAPRSLSHPRHVFHSFSAPRHPPYTLSSLTTFILGQILLSTLEECGLLMSGCDARYHYQTINYQRATPRRKTDAGSTESHEKSRRARGLKARSK